jgi:hypothetical protein
MTVPLAPGVIGRGSCSPPFRPANHPHPVIILARSQSGALKVAWISHSWDQSDTVVPITRQELGEAYAPPAPLASDRHAVILWRKGRFIVMDAHDVNDGLVLGNGVRVEVTQRVQVSETQWAPFRALAFRAAGWLT